MKKVVVMLLAGMFILMAAGALFAEDIKIGFLVKMPEELWFQNEWKYGQQAADKYGFELIKIGVPDGNKTLSAIDNLAAKGAQGFVICIPDTRLGPAVMAKAGQYGMKVFTVDDQFVGPDGNAMADVPYMGLSASAIGYSVGEELYKEFTNRGWDVAETGALGITFDELNTVKERTDSTMKALADAGFPADKIFSSPEKTTDIPGAFDAASTALTQHPDIKKWLVFSVNDEGVLGTLRAMEDRGVAADDIIAIGIGAGTGLMEFKKEQKTGYFASSLINPYRHGFETAELLYKWIKDGEEPEKDIRTAGMIVTRENYMQVLKDLGLESVIE